MTDTTVPTREQVEDLKQQWLEDDCWDLEKTEGFEAYADELREFAQAKKAEWEAQRVQLWQEKSVRLGLAGDHAAAQRHESLDQWLQASQDFLAAWDENGHDVYTLHGLLTRLTTLCAAQNESILRLEQKIHELQQSQNP